MGFKRSRKDGRPNVVSLFTMLDPLPYTPDSSRDYVGPRFRDNPEGELWFNPRDGYSDDRSDYP